MAGQLGRYRPYPNYRPSGVEWLGDIPSGWGVYQFKRAVEGCVNGIWGSNPKENGQDTVVLRVADFDRRKSSISTEKLTKRYIEESEKSQRRLKKGDLLIEKSGGGEKTLVGQVVLFEQDFEAVTSNFVAKMSPIAGYHSGFLNYAFQGAYSIDLNLRSLKQSIGIQNLDSGAYLSEKWAFPNFNEQTQIAAFLDHETAKIDALIAKQERLIDLLEEKRQAVISHAVTKGLNPDAPLRPSGIDWLGDVPVHWEVKRLKQVAEFNPSKSEVSHLPNDTQVTFLPMEAIGDQGGLDTHRHKSLGEVKTGYTYMRENDVCIAKITPCFENGKGAIMSGLLDGIAFAKTEAIPMRCKERMLPDFLYFLLVSAPFNKQAEGSMYGAGGQKRVSDSFVANYHFSLPSMKEQLEIVDFLKGILSEFDDLDNKAQSAITLLKERRTALISAAVTGKIDVREWQPPKDISDQASEQKAFA